VEARRDRAKLAIEIEEGVRDFCATFDGVDPSSLEGQGTVGEWAVRDVLAHMVFWHERCLTAVRTTMNGTYEPTGDIDENAENAAAVAGHAATPTAQLMDRVKTTGLEISALLGEVPEELWEQKLHLESWVLGTTLNHYADHRDEVRKVLEARA